jgi:hypothetical protein
MWAEGWPMYAKYVWGDIFSPVEETTPEWKGEYLEGKKILVIAIGGIGDQFLFMRWFALLKNQGAKVCYLCPETIACVLQNHPWIDRLMPIPENEDKIVSLEGMDYFVPLMALPERFGATPETIPWSGPYLGIDLPIDTSDKIHLGLCTKAGEFMDSKGRSMNRTQEMALRRQRDWVSLNYGENPDLSSWRDTMEVVSQLRAVVTVDTSVMHLAGAMGKPVYVWPGSEPNWKFFGGRLDSPFYPTMKVIYRTEELLREVKSL